MPKSAQTIDPVSHAHQQPHSPAHTHTDTISDGWSKFKFRPWP